MVQPDASNIEYNLKLTRCFKCRTEPETRTTGSPQMAKSNNCSYISFVILIETQPKTKVRQMQSVLLEDISDSIPPTITKCISFLALLPSTSPNFLDFPLALHMYTALQYYLVLLGLLNLDALYKYHFIAYRAVSLEKLGTKF